MWQGRCHGIGTRIRKQVGTVGTYVLCRRTVWQGMVPYAEGALSPGILPETRWRKLESEAPPGLPAGSSCWLIITLVQPCATSRPRSMQSHFLDHPKQTQLEQAPEAGHVVKVQRLATVQAPHRKSNLTGDLAGMQSSQARQMLQHDCSTVSTGLAEPATDAMLACLAQTSKIYCSLLLLIVDMSPSS